MPVHTSEKDGIVLVRFWGEHTTEEAREAGRASVAGGTEAAPVRILLDVSESASIRSRSTSVLLDTARFFAGFAAVVEKVAIVASDDLAYGLMRMGAAVGENSGLNTQTFRTASAAETWLREEA